MIGFILLAVVMAAAGLAFHYVGRQIENVVRPRLDGAVRDRVTAAIRSGADVGAGGVVRLYSRLPRLIGAFTATAAAFVVLAVGVALVNPPQSEFAVNNVDWASRHGGVLGSTADAILVRTTGASVENGLLYSTATLSGQQYVSLMGSTWIATDAPATIATLSYIFLACIGGLVGVVMERAMSSAQTTVRATTPVAAN